MALFFDSYGIPLSYRLFIKEKFSEKELEEAKMLTSSIRAKGADEDSLTERLCELAVLWVLLNPNPIPLEKPNYDR